MAIGAIEIQMLADLSRLRKDMSDAQGVIGGAMNGIKGFVTGAMGALAGAMSVTAFASWIKGAVDAADEASKLAKSAGIATKDVAGLKLAFDLGGVGADSMGKVMGKLSKEISEGSKVFDTLGVKTKNADGTLRSTKDVLYDTADAFQEMGASTLTTAKAIEIFGKSGAEMVPMLLDGSEGLREMAEMAEELGLVIDDQTGAAAEKFNDTLDLLGSVSKGVANQLMAQMLPTLNNLAGSMLNTVRSSDLVSQAAQGIGTAFKLLYSGVATVIGGFSAFGTYLGSLAAAAVMVANGEFKQAYATLNEGWKDAGSIVKTTAKTIEDAWQGTGDTTVKQAIAVNEALTGTTQTTKDYEAAVKASEKASKDAAAAAAKQAAEQLKIVTDLAKARSDARQAEEKAIADWERTETERRNKEVRASQDALAAAQLEYDTQGMLRSEIAALTLQRLADKQAAFTVGSANYEAVQLEIEAQKELVAVLQKGEVREASKKSAQDAAAEWQKTADQIGQGLTDSLFRAFESGKGFFRVFWDGIKNLFKTTVMQLLIKPVQTAVTGAVGGMLGLPAAAGTGGSSGGINLGTLASMGGSLGSLGGVFMGGLGSTLTGGLSSAGAMASAGMYGSSAAMALGTVAPYLLAAGALYAAVSRFTKSTPHTGSVVGLDEMGLRTLMGDGSTITDNLSPETDEALKLLTAGSAGTLNALSATFGLTDKFSGVAKFAADNKDATIGQYILGRNGSIAGTVGTATALTGGGSYAMYSSDAAAAYNQYAADVAAVTLKALKELDLPAWAKEQLDALGAGSSLADINRVANEIAEAKAERDAQSTTASDDWASSPAFEPIGRSEMLDALTALTDAVKAQPVADVAAAARDTAGGVDGLAVQSADANRVTSELLQSIADRVAAIETVMDRAVAGAVGAPA